MNPMLTSQNLAHNTERIEIVTARDRAEDANADYERRHENNNAACQCRYHRLHISEDIMVTQKRESEKSLLNQYLNY